MTKPFLVINVPEGKVGRIYQRDTFDEAVAQGVAMAKEQCGVDEEAIRQELTDDGNFVPEGGGFEIVIAQPEDD